MPEQPPKQMAVWKILLTVGIMAIAIYIIGESLRPTKQTQHTASNVLDRVKDQAPAQSEQGQMLKTSLSPTMQAQPGVNARALKTYYARRAYNGAPPVIPHAVDPEIARTMNCNVCHFPVCSFGR